MAAVVRVKESGLKDAAIKGYDWFSSHPFFNWRWSILDLAVIAILVFR